MEAFVVPEPADPVEVPGFAEVCLPLEHAEAAEEQLNVLEQFAGLTDRGPPEND